MKSCALRGEPDQSGINEAMLRVGPSGNAQQDIRVNKTRGDSHLVVILVNPLPGNSRRQGRNLVRELSKRVEPGTNLFWSA
jgi:hypothetical protein